MQNKNIGNLLTPSWVTNLVGIASGLLITGGTIVLSRYQGSALRQQIFEAQAHQTTSTTAGVYQNVTDNIAKSSFLGTLPLLLTWAAVGLVVYFFAISIARSFGQAADIRDQLKYGSGSRRALIKQIALQTLARILAVAVWFLFIKISLSIALPYALAAANVASNAFNLTNSCYALLAVIVLYADIYVHTVLLRLIALRPRLLN